MRCRNILLIGLLLIVSSAQVKGQDSTTSSNKHYKILVAVGAGLAEPVQQVPLFFTHYELTTGIEFLESYQVVARFEGATYADIYRYSGLQYISGFTAPTVAFRYFPFDRFFGTAGIGYSSAWSDSARANYPSTDSFGPAKGSTAIAFGGLGYCWDIIYVEVREYFGTRKIQAFDRPATSFSAMTLGVGLHWEF